MSFYDTSMQMIDGSTKSLSEFKGNVVLVVNVASECGLTGQYKRLQGLYQDRKEDGLVVLGVPCNQFGAQEPGSEEEIVQFCESNFGVTFPMTSKVNVNGEHRHPLYVWLTSQDPGPADSGDIAWNFEKFVIGRDGSLRARFEPTTTPEAPVLVAAIDDALADHS